MLIVDERVGETFTAAGDDVEWMMYGWSVLHCLPVGMADTPSAGDRHGACARTRCGATPLEAGFRDVEILPIEQLLLPLLSPPCVMTPAASRSQDTP